MNDSTYLNASDPNSMRDQGHTRNAVYNVGIEDNPKLHSKYLSSIAFSKTQSDFSSEGYAEYLRRNGATNNTFYSFGGKSGIKETIKGSNPLINPVFTDHWAGCDAQRTMPRAEQVNYIKNPLERVNDYTKNISQSIFSPGLHKGKMISHVRRGSRQLQRAKVNEKLQYRKPANYRTPQSAKPVSRKHRELLDIAS